MGARTQFAPGTFAWVDLATTDAAGAAAFYGALLGWEHEAHAGPYGLFRRDGAVVAGVFTQPAAMWTGYVAVEDADASSRRAQELGCTVLRGPFDAGDAGRIAILSDPQGACIGLWQAGSRAGAERVNDPGCLCMNELVSPDRPAAEAFYGELFGWTADASLLFNAGSLNGAVYPGDPARWRPCFTVGDLSRALGRAQGLGAEVTAGPTELPDGAVATIRDPQGAELSLYAGEVDP